MLKLVDICGCIATGKSTLAQALSQYCGYTLLQEHLEDNPYLEAFIANPSRWALNNQLFFLIHLLADELKIRRESGVIIRDYSLEDRYIYAQCFYDQGWLSKEDYVFYISFLDWVRQFIKEPDVIVFLEASPQTLRTRALCRTFKHPVVLSYLEMLHSLFISWAQRFRRIPLIRVNTEEVDLRVPDNIRPLVDQLRVYLL